MKMKIEFGPYFGILISVDSPKNLHTFRIFLLFPEKRKEKPLPTKKTFKLIEKEKSPERRRGRERKGNGIFGALAFVVPCRKEDMEDNRRTEKMKKRIWWSKLCVSHTCATISSPLRSADELGLRNRVKKKLTRKKRKKRKKNINEHIAW